MDFFLGWVLFDFLSWGWLGGSQGCPLVAGPPLIYIISLLHFPLNFTSPQSVKIPTVCGDLKHWTTIIVVQLLNIGSWPTIIVAQCSSAQFRFKVKLWSSHSLPANHCFQLSYRNFRFQEKENSDVHFPPLAAASLKCFSTRATESISRYSAVSNVPCGVQSAF